MFNIPNLPTDNLYKFKFLGGIAILAFTAYLYSTQLNNSLSKLIELEIEVQSAQYQTIVLELKSIEIKEEKTAFKSNYKKIKITERDSVFDLNKMKEDLLTDKNYREYLEFIFRHKTEILPIGQNIERLEKLRAEENKIVLELEKNLITAKTSLTRMKYEIYRLILISIISLLLFHFGRKITIVSYKEWYDLVQKPNDEKLKEEIEKLKTDNQKKL